MKSSINDKGLIEKLKEEREILKLQQKYDAGKITEDDLQEEEKEKLIVLYKKQIETLEMDIAINKKKLENYKNKIIRIKKRLS